MVGASRGFDRATDQRWRGRMAARSCRACGLRLREGARFCDGCGAPVTTAPEPAEYKQVTVMFATWCGRWTLPPPLGAERLREIMSQLVERSAVLGATIRRHRESVHRGRHHGGFRCTDRDGRPRVRACLAALGVQEDTRRMTAESRRATGVSLQLRVGLQFRAGDSRRIGYGPYGLHRDRRTVGMAQRNGVGGAARWIVLSESTARLVEHSAALARSSMCASKAPTPLHLPRRLLAAGAEHTRPSGGSPPWSGAHGRCTRWPY
jgi:hypothetical protein